MSGEMADPVPENISGEKSVAYVHKVNHQIHWGHVTLGAAAILVLAYIWANVDLGDDEQEGIGA